MTVARSKSQLQEQLVQLYLRLNGFFVTGFIVHSSICGRNRAELDALALRMPFNSEPERQIGADPLLDLSDRYTELAICEVKSRGRPLQFNASLVGQPVTTAAILRWAGMFRDSEIEQLSQALAEALTPQNPAAAEAPVIFGPRSVRVRGLLFSPERTSRHRNQSWFVTGPEIFRYVWQCLCPETPRRFCSTTYDFQAWGSHEPIVDYFKSRGSRGPGDVKALYAFVLGNQH